MAELRTMDDQGIHRFRRRVRIANLSLADAQVSVATLAPHFLCKAELQLHHLY